jgi:hypothetical protein
LEGGKIPEGSTYEGKGSASGVRTPYRGLATPRIPAGQQGLTKACAEWAGWGVFPSIIQVFTCAEKIIGKKRNRQETPLRLPAPLPQDAAGLHLQAAA